MVLSRPTRCRILDSVIRLLPVIHAEKTGGSRPWTREWPQRSSPALRTVARAGPTQRGRALLSRWASARDILRGARCASPGIPTQGGSLPQGLNRGGVNQDQRGVPISLSPFGLSGGAVYLLRDLHPAVGADKQFRLPSLACGVTTEQR